MIARRILTVTCLVFVLAEARWHRKRSIPSICDPTNYSGKVRCYCRNDPNDSQVIIQAYCFVTTERIKMNDHEWDDLSQLKMTPNVTFKNDKGIPLPYIPTHGLKHLENVNVLTFKSGGFTSIEPYAFANLSSIEELNVYDCQVKTLSHHAFAHHKDVIEIQLDKNYLTEINRDVFVDLPSIERLFITHNYITTIHDRAFLHLNNLKELELNVNKIFSLNMETFAGLWKLEKLDLGTNKIQVIGDNTFLPLQNLEYLDLSWNGIQVLDDKAFHGLAKLKTLSLAYNKLSNFDNTRVFVGLKSLINLHLNSNAMKRMKDGVLAPIMENFYDAKSYLDLKENYFTCDCGLEWLMPLMNKTRNKYLEIDLENLKCVPSDKLREAYRKMRDEERNGGLTYDEIPAGAEYEYYDYGSLNGKLFYTDVRDLLYCDPLATPVQQRVVPTKTSASDGRKVKKPNSTSTTIVATQPPITTTASVTNQVSTETHNSGLLDLSLDESTPVDIDKNAEQKKVDFTVDKSTPIDDDEAIEQKKMDVSMEESKTTVKKSVEQKKVDLSTDDSKMNVDKSAEQKKDDSYTTTRLATVSANPIEKTNMYDKMASDEALPDKLKAQRRQQLQFDNKYMSSNGNNKTACVSFIALICFWLFKLY